MRRDADCTVVMVTGAEHCNTVLVCIAGYCFIGRIGTEYTVLLVSNIV